MTKRLGTFAAALAFTATAATVFSVPASAATNTASFDVSATVGAIATISFANSTAPSGTFSWAASDFTTPQGYKAADNNPGTISGTFRTSKTGSGSIYFTAPATITGTGGQSLTVNSVMQFTCGGGTYTPNGGSSTSLGGGTTTQGAVATGTTQNACATIPAQTNYSTFSIPLNLYLNADSLPSDTYTSSSGAFVITISAT